jgi:hypothetical protein
MLGDACVLPVTVRTTRFSDYLSDEDVARVRDSELDVLLRFGFRILKGSILQAANEELDNGQVIYRSYARTDGSSVWRNRNNYYWKSAQFVIRKLRDVFENGATAVAECSGGCNEVSVYSERLFRYPHNLETVGDCVPAVQEQVR